MKIQQSLETLYFNTVYLYTYSTSNRKSVSYNQHFRRKNCNSSLTFELILFLSTPETFSKRNKGKLVLNPEGSTRN